MFPETGQIEITNTLALGPNPSSEDLVAAKKAFT